MTGDKDRDTMPTKSLYVQTDKVIVCIDRQSHCLDRQIHCIYGQRQRQRYNDDKVQTKLFNVQTDKIVVSMDKDKDTVIVCVDRQSHWICRQRQAVYTYNHCVIVSIDKVIVSMNTKSFSTK